MKYSRCFYKLLPWLCLQSSPHPHISRFTLGTYYCSLNQASSFQGLLLSSLTGFPPRCTSWPTLMSIPGVFSPASGSTWPQLLCLDLCSRKVLRWLPCFVSLLMNTIWQEPRIGVPKDCWPVIFILSLSDEACCPIVNCTVEGSMVRSRKQLAAGNL